MKLKSTNNYPQISLLISFWVFFKVDKIKDKIKNSKYNFKNESLLDINVIQRQNFLEELNFRNND